VSNIPSTYELDPSRDVGVIVLSTSFSDNCGSVVQSSISVELLAVDARPPAGDFLLWNPLVLQDFTDPPGYLFIWELNAGRYKLGGLSKDVGGGGYESDNTLGLKFTVTRGQVHYLGELHVNLRSCDGFGVGVYDAQERDSRVFDERMENLSSRQWKRETLHR
jgi:hypothetical protein